MNSKKTTIYRMVVLLIAASTIFISSGCRKNKPADLSPKMNSEALGELIDCMNTQEEWVKVHAAEYLLSLNDSGIQKQVREVFEKELVENGDVPKYRIGIWRTLSKCYDSPEKRQEYIDKIMAAFMDVDGPDFLHATETLGKLKVQLNEKQLARAKELYDTESENSGQIGCAAWLLSVQPNIDAANLLLQEVKSKNQNRMRISGYVIYFNRLKLDQSQWSELVDIAMAQPDDAASVSELLSGAVISCPEKDARYQEAYDRLLSLVVEPKSSSRRQISTVISVVGDSEDMKIVDNLLNDKYPLVMKDGQIDEAANADVRSTAARARLYYDSKTE